MTMHVLEMEKALESILRLDDRYAQGFSVEDVGSLWAARMEQLQEDWRKYPAYDHARRGQVPDVADHDHLACWTISRWWWLGMLHTERADGRRPHLMMTPQRSGKLAAAGSPDFEMRFVFSLPDGHPKRGWRNGPPATMPPFCSSNTKLKAASTPLASVFRRISQQTKPHSVKLARLPKTTTVRLK